MEKSVVISVQPEKYGDFSLRCTEAPNVSLALVATERGDIVGFTRGAVPSGSASGSGDYLCETIASLQDLLKPRLVNVAFGFAAGDTRRVVYEFVAVVDDPLGRVKSPQIHFQTEQPPPPEGLDEREKRFYRWPGKLPADGKWSTTLLPKASKLELTQKQPSEVVARQLPWLLRYTDAVTYVVQFETEHPGDRPTYQFYSLVSCTDSEDNAVNVRPYLLEFRPSRIAGNLPDFPGLDGFPIDYPRPVALSDGGYRVTSERTRLDPPEPKKFVVPIPKPSGKSVAGQLLRAGDADAVLISLPHPVSRQGLSMPDMPVAFSADGAWLFYVDLDHVLRKISTSDFQQHSYLDAAGCTSLAYSSAGLLVAANDANVVWVVDPATLKVEHVIRVQGVHSIAASPASSIGFAVGYVKEEDRSSYAQLVMLDLKEGRPLHRIKNSYRNRPFPSISNTTLFSNGFGTPYMSLDGKRLFLAGHYSEKKCYQFRIDGEDLIFERVLRAYPITIGNRQFGTQNQRKVDIHDLTDDETAKFTLEGAIGFHPKTNLVYESSHQTRREIRVYDPQGKLTTSYPKPVEANASRVLCHPKQDQAVFWGHGRIIYLDFQTGRLPKALGRPRPD